MLLLRRPTRQFCLQTFQQGRKGIKGKQDQKARLDRKGHKVRQARKEQPAPQARKGQQVQEGHRVRHLVLVYDDGTQPGDINTSLTVPPTNQPVPPLIADPNRRIYRGLDPSTQPQDRVEVVHFANPGTYLVICGASYHISKRACMASSRCCRSPS